jgi:hypothetical protein
VYQLVEGGISSTVSPVSPNMDEAQTLTLASSPV